MLALGHHRPEDLHWQHGAEQVEVDDLPERLERQVEDRIARRERRPGDIAPGGVDQDVDLAMLLHDLVADACQCVGIEHIPGDADRLAAIGVDLVRAGVDELLAPPDEDHLRARLREPAGDRPTEHAATTRDDRDLAIQTELSLQPILCHAQPFPDVIVTFRASIRRERGRGKTDQAGHRPPGPRLRWPRRVAISRT